MTARWVPWLRRGARPFLEPEQEEWQLGAWSWLLRDLGGVAALRRVPLVKPSREFFPPTEAAGHARAEHVFEHVKRHAAMADRHCRFVAQPRGPDLRLGELATLRREQPTAAGTFGLEGNEPVITYDPAVVDDPMRLVAVLAHELAHHRFPAPPGGSRLLAERATDLATVAMGFGVFGANCAFSFEQFQGVMSQGWRSSRLGYLDEREWAFALAVFLELADRGDEDVRRCLKPHLLTDVRAARRSLRRRPELLAGLRARGEAAAPG